MDFEKKFTIVSLCIFSLIFIAVLINDSAESKKYDTKYVYPVDTPLPTAETTSEPIQVYDCAINADVIKPLTVDEMSKGQIVKKSKKTHKKKTKKKKKENKKSITETYVVTAYCPCRKCSGSYGGVTSTGVIAKEGRTIAVDPNVIPYGTKVKLDGNVYIAEDCGGAVKGKHIDLFFDNHQTALDWGVRYCEIEILKGDK